MKRNLVKARRILIKEARRQFKKALKATCYNDNVEFYLENIRQVNCILKGQRT